MRAAIKGLVVVEGEEVTSVTARYLAAGGGDKGVTAWVSLRLWEGLLHKNFKEGGLQD